MEQEINSLSACLVLLMSSVGFFPERTIRSIYSLYNDLYPHTPPSASLQINQVYIVLVLIQWKFKIVLSLTYTSLNQFKNKIA